MKIALVTPAPRGSRSGNRTTAMRWARLLGELGHRVRVSVEYGGGDYDGMIALHAWRSSDAIQRFRDRYPNRPLIVALTGTDIYRFLHSDPEPTRRSIELADRLVVIHEAVFDALPASLHYKVHIIFQSASPLARPRAPAKRTFDVCLVAHLREEKDPLRAAYAAHDLPPSSRVRIVHVGKAHDAHWAEQAEAEARRNPRYEWRGDVPFGKVRQLYGRARVMVLSSRMEGGANVVSEAVVAGLPVIASAIPGSFGLLGADYPAYFPVGDTDALRDLLARAEQEPDFLQELTHRCESRAPLFTPAAERAAWRTLLAHFDA